MNTNAPRSWVMRMRRIHLWVNVPQASALMNMYAPLKTRAAASSVRHA